MDLGSGSGSVIGNTIGSSSGTNIGLLRSPKSRISSKSSGFSVTVDLPTIRPSAGIYSPKLQKNLSRINTLFGDENDRRSDSNSSQTSSQTSSDSESYSSGGSDSEEKTPKIVSEQFNDIPPISGIIESDIPNITENVEAEFETENHEENPSGRGKINEGVVKIKQLSQEPETSVDYDDSPFLYKHNTEATNKSNDINKLPTGQSPKAFTDFGQEHKHADHGSDFENSNNNKTQLQKSPDFFISEANSLLNHRIKLMDDLHMSPTATDPVSTFIRSESESVDPSEDSVNGKSMSPDITPQPQLMVATKSDYSVLTNLPNGNNNSLSLNKNKRSTLSSSNRPLEMNQVLFEKHPTMSMKHYTKIMNRAKHVGAYLTSYYAYIQEYQEIHHPREKTAETMYPGVEGVWNPLQIMRNRRVRMRTGEKLKKLTMHGQKVGVGELYNLNDSLSNLTSVTTTSLPLGVVNSRHNATENAGLGILSEANNFFHHDWRKVKVASRVFSRHSKQRLIWQIGLHEIIGDLAWREGKWNELRDPSGRRWFPKHSDEAISHKHSTNSGTNTSHTNNLRNEDTMDGSDHSEHKIRKIHDLLFVDDSVTGEGPEVVKHSKKKHHKKEDDDHSSSRSRSGSGSGSANSDKKTGRIKEISKEKTKGDSKDKEKDSDKDKEKIRESDRDYDKEKDKEREKDRTGSLRRKNENLASVARFKHYKKKSSTITSSPNKGNELGMPVIRVEKSAGNSSLDENIGGGSGHGSNSNSVSYKTDACSSLASDVGFYDAMDEVLEFLRLTRSISGYIESNKYELLIKEFTVHEQLTENRDRLGKKVEEIESLENESIVKYSKLLEMVEAVEGEVEKHRSFTGIRANKIEELLGYCDRTNGEINTSIALKIRNLNERADSMSVQSENKVLVEYLYKVAEASIVGVLWFIWIVVELWLWCKWGVKTTIGVVKWVLI